MASQKKGGWGSLFSGAVANLESRLDTILADDNEASARQRAAEDAAKQAKSDGQRTESQNLTTASAGASDKGSRDVSRTRVNERLAERLAKATQQKVPSRTSTPVPDGDTVSTSGEGRASGDLARSAQEIGKPSEPTEGSTTTEALQPEAQEGKPQAAVVSSSHLSVDPPRVSIESSRPSTEFTGAEVASSRPSLELANGHAANDEDGLQQELEQIRKETAEEDNQRQEEMLEYLERIDALQSKLAYLAKETVAAAREANVSSTNNTVEKQLAEKDERIALLMEEGQTLSKTEMKHLQTIKKLRTKSNEEEKVSALLKKKLERAERSELDLKSKLRHAEVAERQANDKAKEIAVVESQLEGMRVERDSATEQVKNLNVQLKETREKAAQAEQEAVRKASEAERGKIASLQNDLEDAQIEKKLAQDRAVSHIKKAEEDAAHVQERFSVRELELKNDIAGLEARLEGMRARAEEASAHPSGTEGESNVKLLRQVETLQQQYALAKTNWETIEASLNSRNAALEKERDDAAHRENEVRKRARDVGIEFRNAKEELANTTDQVKQLRREGASHLEEINGLHAKLQQVETAQANAKADFDRQRKIWDTDFSQRLEEEKIKWRRGAPSPGATGHGFRSDSLALGANRKTSAADGLHLDARRNFKRLGSYESPTPSSETRPVSRRSSGMPGPPSRSPAFPTDRPDTIPRRETSMSIETQSIPPTPSIEVENHFDDDDFDTTSSPQRTINELVSPSANEPGVGPSVQLVERMSALVRKLESEKATFKDELSRLSNQRDEARNEVVALMREVEEKRSQDRRVSGLEKELRELQGRYEASLEMLGEREEEVEELKLDVVELKRIYRELVEDKVGR